MAKSDSASVDRRGFIKGAAVGPRNGAQVVENTPSAHNVIVCTLCSCYPWPLLGLAPTWYKSHAYRNTPHGQPVKLGRPPS